MIPIPSLWLPILVSAVLVFIASSILHMVFKYHHREYRKLSNEDAAADAIRGAAPGLYHLPHCDGPGDMKDPEVAAKFDRGPVAFVTVVPDGMPDMRKFLGQWLAYLVVVGIFIAYLTGRTHGPGTSYLAIFRFVGTLAFMTYGLSEVVASIWKGSPWSMTCKTLFDGLVYATLTAGVFGWLWPA